MQGFLIVGLVTLGMVNCKAIQPEDDKAEMAEEKDAIEGDEEVVTKAPYVPGGDKRPFLRGGPGGQGGYFNPRIPDFVPDPSVTNPGGQGYNPGNSGGQGYNPGNNGGQGYNPGNNGGQGYNPGGYNPGGRNGDEIHFPGNGIGGRSQFRTPTVFADDENTSGEGQAKP